MSKVIDRNEVRRLLERESAQLLDVLPRDDYAAEHIAGAVNLPYRSSTRNRRIASTRAGR